MTKANDLASLLDANGDVVSSALDNVPAADLVNDTTPQLGGNLDAQSNDITSVGNMGIGTSSPYGKFTIKASGNGYVDGLIFEDADSTTRSAITHVDGTTYFSGNTSADHMVLTSGGNVGIGTTSPDINSGLTIFSSVYPSLYLNNNSTTGGGAVRFHKQGVNQGVVAGSGWILGDTSNDIAVQAGTGNALRFYTNGNNERLRIDNSGNVGIGTTSPISGGANGKWLTLDGTTYSGGVVYSVSGTAKGYTYWDNGGELRLQSSTGIEFLANNAVAAAIKSNGVVAQKGDNGWESKILFSGDGSSPYIQVKTNIRRTTNVMYYAHIIGHKSYDGSRVNTILTGYAYAAYIGTQSSQYHGYSNLGTYGIQDVYYSSDDYMCFTIDSGYSAYSMTLGTNMSGYSLSTQPDILSYTNQSSTTRYY